MTATYRADVIVAGGGLAGLVTAIELLDRGRSVVLLERGPVERLGGLARESFGGIFIVGSPEQRRTGIRDNVDLALRDWIGYGELAESEVWPRRWAEAYVTGCRERVYDWLRQRGVGFFPVVHWVERGLEPPGNSVPRFHMVWGTGQGLILALLEHLERHPHRDRLLVLAGHRVTELLRTAGKVNGCAGRIESPPSAEKVNGSAQRVETIPAAGGVVNAGHEFTAEGDCLVIASGGIMGNLEAVRRHWFRGWGEPPPGLLNGSDPTADGHLHREARRHGASVTHLDRMWLYAAGVRHWKPRHPAHGLSLVPPKSALWVDSRGQRLGRPPLVTGYDTRYLVETVCRQRHPYSWQILNWRIAKRELAVSGAELNHAMRDKRLLAFLATIVHGNEALVRDLVERCPDFVTATSLPQLVERMNELVDSDPVGGDFIDSSHVDGDSVGTDPVDPNSVAADRVDADLLAREVRAYDTNVARGEASDDPQVQLIARARRYRGDRARTCKFARIEDPRGMPLIAIRERPITRKSLGGIQTDLSCRVLDGAGVPVPGLFAVGEAAGFGGGGIHGIRSLEGTFLGGCIFGGRLAGSAIARG